MSFGSRVWVLGFSGCGASILGPGDFWGVGHGIRREVLKRAVEALAPAALLGSTKTSTFQTVNPKTLKAEAHNPRCEVLHASFATAGLKS